ncbi:glycosyltransferase family 4 protein [Microcystis aeruginosa]|uniref:glycosyltransferase family 4 protein n=1 Tax=Microcystis aeruginosa TaxID=1126 RepID=UPI002330A05D|nr:glycosyltransferase family 4 protein [Microcystis aeruginosa]MDB9414020.1 glycosyltransferase family 4 protein [Microcystis aeruginosa CS-567/02]
MHILVISNYYGLINGASICTWELIKRWSSQVERIDVVCSQKWYYPEGLSESNNVFVHPLTSFTPIQIRAKCKALVAKDTVIYGADDYGVFGKFKGVPYVLTYHGNWPQALKISTAFFMKGLFHISIYVFNFLLADAVVCPNYFHISWISQFTSIDKVRMIRNGIGLNSLNSSTFIAHPAIISVGNMDERKGKLLSDIIDALLEASERFQWHLYIAGKISYKPLIKLVDNKRVFSLGFISNVADYVKEADVFILASYMDLVSLAVTEAMALSKPVICFDVGALHEVVSSETGDIVPPFDVKRFAQSTLELLGDEEKRHEKGRKAKEAVKDFDWDKSASEYLNLFRELLS